MGHREQSRRDNTLKNSLIRSRAKERRKCQENDPLPLQRCDTKGYPFPHVPLNEGTVLLTDELATLATVPGTSWSVLNAD